MLALAVAFYEEDGFATLKGDLRVLLESTAARVAVVESDHQLIAVAVTTTSFGLENGLIAALEDLYVAPQAQRQGFAEKLIDDSAGWARDQSCHHFDAVVAPNGHDVTHLHDFYKARRFHDDGRRLLSRSL